MQNINASVIAVSALLNQFDSLKFYTCGNIVRMWKYCGNVEHCSLSMCSNTWLGINFLVKRLTIAI